MSLQDDTLRHLFLALGGVSLRDSGPRFEHQDARNLGNCNMRLHALYRNSIRKLLLGKSYSESECTRIWQRFPGITSIHFDLCSIPGYRNDDFASGARPPGGVLGTGLVRTGVKSISFGNSCVPVRELRAMMESFTGLESFEFVSGGVYLDRDSSDYTDERCSFSLERHAATLESLNFVSSSLSILGAGEQFPNGALDEDDNEVDLRWLQLSNLVALDCLKLSSITVAGNSFSHLSTPSRITSLSLTRLPISDEDMVAILSSQPQLRSIALRGCLELSDRILLSLPTHLDSLDITASRILKPSHFELLERGSKASKVVKNLSLGGALSPFTFVETEELCTDFFFRVVDGRSIIQLDLSSSRLDSPDNVVALLSESPNIVTLKLGLIGDMVSVSIYCAISQLSKLCDLDLYRTRASVLDSTTLDLLAGGPCKHSLRLIILSLRRALTMQTFRMNAESVQKRKDEDMLNIANLRLRVAQRFDICDVQLSLA